MYNTPITRMLCVLNGYSGIIASYQRNFAMGINQEFHLESKEFGLYIQRSPESLHNLKSEPGKAYQIISRMKHVLKDSINGKKDITLLASFLRQDVSCNYQNDPDALLFAESVICRMIELAADDSQFSEFSYFGNPNQIGIAPKDEFGGPLQWPGREIHKEVWSEFEKGSEDGISWR